MKKKDVDVTDKVGVGMIDDESLPLTKCICGVVFIPWEMVLGIYKDDPTTCPYCHRKFYFTNNISVYEVKE